MTEKLGLQFDFVKGNTRSMDTDEWIHRLTAHANGQEIGRLEWYPKSRTVSEVFVDPDFRRRGVATALWNEAHSVARSTRGVQPPRHSPMRTNAGDAWARAVGGRVPPRLK